MQSKNASKFILVNLSPAVYDELHELAELSQLEVSDIVAIEMEAFVWRLNTSENSPEGVTLN